MKALWLFFRSLLQQDKTKEYAGKLEIEKEEFYNKRGTIFVWTSEEENKQYLTLVQHYW